MNLRRLIGRLLAVFVIAGLLVTPLAGPAAAQRMAAGMSAMSADMLSKDMPCCPDGQRKNCQGCPTVAMCMTTMAQAEPSAAGVIQIHFQIRRLTFAFENLSADGLTGAPPDHPPRILI
jgi:hypothetical protein